MKIITLRNFVVLGVILLVTACSSSKNNTAPVADAGADQTDNVVVGDVVLLDGSKSSDADGDALSYQWSLTPAPGSSADLSDPASEKPSFEPDIAGTYVAQLIVDDGGLESTPDTVQIVVVKAAPTVVIDTPSDQATTAVSPIGVTGTVDDPDATITVNGIATANNNGSYTTNTTLADGANTITVVAANSTGNGSASATVYKVGVTLQIPYIVITSHQNGFTVGATWRPLESETDPNQASVTVRGLTVIANALAPPVVTVNTVPAVVTVSRVGPAVTAYNFTADIQLMKGTGRAINATVTDTGGNNKSALVTGVADTCQIAEYDEDYSQLRMIGIGSALRGNNQNNVCHTIDGCSLPIVGAGSEPDDDVANNPMLKINPENLLLKERGTSTKFGDGVRARTSTSMKDPDLKRENWVAPDEFFVYGLKSDFPKGCNEHDVCYQTCVPPEQRAAVWRACNSQMYEDDKEICRKAYPKNTECPYTGLEIWKCPAWRTQWLYEKEYCFTAALKYHVGVSTGAGAVDDPLRDNLGWGKFVLRQEQHCKNL